MGSELEGRPISAEERRLITWLLSKVLETADASRYLSQLEQLRVIDRCGCGCGSLTFRKGQGGMGRIADCTGRSPEGVEVWVALYTDESDFLCCLDFNPMDDMPHGGITLPPPESLFVD